MAHKLIKELLEINRQQAEVYNDPGKTDERERYRGQHPTRIACFKCMDGRVNIAELTRTPFGLIRPFRNIGGAFEIGWNAFENRLQDFVDYTLRERAQNLFIATYHFSKSDPHLGCRGHGYDRDRSVRSAAGLVGQFETVFGKGHEQVYPIMVGVETDGEELLFHGDGRSMPMSDCIGLKDEELLDVINDLYPDISRQVAEDLVPLMAGNARHVAQLRKNPKPKDRLEHMENGLFLGEGFDWYHKVNSALIINDLDPTLDDTIGKAAGIIKENREKGRISKDGALLFVSVRYYEKGRRRNGAIERAKYLTGLGLESIVKFHPDLKGYFKTLTAVMSWDTRELEVIE